MPTSWVCKDNKIIFDISYCKRKAQLYRLEDPPKGTQIYFFVNLKKLCIIFIHVHQTAIVVLAVVAFLSDNLREKVSVPDQIVRYCMSLFICLFLILT